MLAVLILLASCATAEANPPDAWQDYDSLTALHDDAELVVTGVAQRQAGTDDAPVVQFSITGTYAGTAPADDPVLVRLDPDVPLDLHPGFQYMLYLRAGDDDTFAVVGPGAFERPPGSPLYERVREAPSTLPVTVTTSDLGAG